MRISLQLTTVHITEDLTWTTHIDILVRKAKQRLYLRQLRKFWDSRRILQTIYVGVEHPDRKHHCLVRQQLLLGQAEHIIGTTLPTLQDLQARRCPTRACRFIKDPHHPNNKLFQLLRSGKRLRSHAARTERLRQSFFPQANRTVNSDLTRAPPMHTLTCTLIWSLTLFYIFLYLVNFYTAFYIFFIFLIPAGLFLL